MTNYLDCFGKVFIDGDEVLVSIVEDNDSHIFAGQVTSTTNESMSITYENSGDEIILWFYQQDKNINNVYKL